MVLSKSWESFQRSLDALAEARHRDMSDSFVLSGTSAKFSITFDLSWKVMKDLLIQHYAITDFVAESPIEVLGKAYNADLISDDIWMEMLKIRNQLAHDYDGVIVKEYCQKIIGEYIDHLYAFKEHVVTLLGGRCVENQET
ncbi:MAG TPA: nucleotidyltransferase substrate binding protein [Candidatus Mediterraneibacter gallistercoris]|uniref:Nucleotidyltransferase substrate binding protein n=1 Tax=Candidatus Mediterraneibacter gallistercoris TaxID=2838671 RepID=A0A9D2T3L9_9FIRM|nr:nucleotidyltransferase substrate binding protein [Candidatus Mediterraneibacter gallistercoris]